MIADEPETCTVRPATPDDCSLIAEMVRELAEYERLADQAKATAEDFHCHLFGDRPSAEAAIVEVGAQPVGFALWFTTFSTFLGRPGMYLEDIYVRPTYRGRGIGKAILGRLAQLAMDRGCGRLEWSVLNWNTPAIGFYEAMGARPVGEWTVYRLTGEPLRLLAEAGSLEPKVSP